MPILVGKQEHAKSKLWVQYHLTLESMPASRMRKAERIADELTENSEAITGLLAWSCELDGEKLLHELLEQYLDIANCAIAKMELYEF